MASSSSKTLHLLFRAARKTVTTTRTTNTTTAPILAKKRRSATMKKPAPPPPPPPSNYDDHLQHRYISNFADPPSPTINIELSQQVESYLAPSPSLPPPPVDDGPDNTLVEEDDDSNQPSPIPISSTLSMSGFPLVDKSDSEEASSLNSETHSPTILTNAEQHRKEVSHDRKQKLNFKNTRGVKFRNIIHSFASKFGADHIVRIFSKLGRDTGLKEYRSLIGFCIKDARKCEDEETLLEYICIANELFNKMKEQRCRIAEDTYGPFLMFLIEMHREDELFALIGTLKDGISISISRLGYYEMLFAIEVNDETKIQGLSNQIASGDSPKMSTLQEQYLLALCAGDRKKELLKVLERIDIKLSTVENLPLIFSCLGRLSLEVLAVKFISELKECG